MLTADRNRNRLVIVLLVGATILLGLASRRWDYFLPGLLHKNTGDVLWAAMAFWLWGLLFARRSTGFIAAVTTVFCIGIEFFKFIHTPGLDAIRATVLGRLVFGYLFSWSNLLCYLLGIALAALADMAITAKPIPPDTMRA